METRLAARAPDTPARVSAAALNKRRQLADIGKLAPHVKKKKKKRIMISSEIPLFGFELGAYLRLFMYR